MEDYLEREFAIADFEIIQKQEEINIQNIEEMENVCCSDFGMIELMSAVNELIQAVKQLDKKIKEDKQ